MSTTTNKRKDAFAIPMESSKKKWRRETDAFDVLMKNSRMPDAFCEAAGAADLGFLPKNHVVLTRIIEDMQK
jgi:hypothetical protein